MRRCAHTVGHAACELVIFRYLESNSTVKMYGHEKQSQNHQVENLQRQDHEISYAIQLYTANSEKCADVGEAKGVRTTSYLRENHTVWERRTRQGSPAAEGL